MKKTVVAIFRFHYSFDSILTVLVVATGQRLKKLTMKRFVVSENFVRMTGREVSLLPRVEATQIFLHVPSF